MKSGKHGQRNDLWTKELRCCLEEYTACRYLQVAYLGGTERIYTTTYEFYDAKYLFKVYKDIERYVLDEGISNAELDSLEWQRNVTIYTGRQLPNISQRLSQCCIAAGIKDVTQTDLDQRFSAINSSHIGEIVLKNACLAEEVRKQRYGSTTPPNDYAPLPIFGRLLSLIALCGMSEICIADITAILGKMSMFETVARARIASLRRQHPSSVINSVLFGGCTESTANLAANKASTFRGERVMVGRIEEPGRARFDTLWENNLCEFAETVDPRHAVGTPIYMLSGWANLIAHREEIGKRHPSLGNVVQSGCYISTGSTDVHGNVYMHPGSLRSILFTIKALSDGSLMAKPRRFDIFDYQNSDEDGAGEERHFGGMVGRATPCGCYPDPIKGRMTLDWRYGDELRLRNRDYAGNAIEHTQGLSTNNISVLWRPGDYPLGVFLMQTLPQSSYVQGKGECLYCAIENAAMAGCPEVIVCGGVRESESPRISGPGSTKAMSLPAELQIGKRGDPIRLANPSDRAQSKSVGPIANDANITTGPVQLLDPRIRSITGGRGAALEDERAQPIPSSLQVRNVTYTAPRQTSASSRTSPGARDVDAWLQNVGPFHKDPAQTVFESIPLGDNRAGSSTIYNIAHDAMRDPELETSKDKRASKQANSSLQKWPIKPGNDNSHDRRNTAPTESPEGLTPPPRPPKEPYFETVSDEHLPLRPTTSNNSEQSRVGVPQENAHMLSTTSRQSLPIISGRYNTTSPGPSPNYISSHSDPSLLSLGSSDAQSVGTARPMTITRAQPIPPVDFGSQMASQTMPSPSPASSMFPLPSRSSPLSKHAFETRQPPQHRRDSSGQESTSARPILNTHTRPLSPDGAVGTPIVEAAPPMTPQQAQPESQSSRFPRPFSQASTAPPSISPPPPYSNRNARTNQRMRSYYAFAEQRSDQIIHGSNPLSATHPALRMESSGWLTAAPASQSAGGLSQSPATSPPIQEPRPLSSFTVMSDDTIDTLPPMRSPPSSINSESPPMSTHPSFQNRPASSASAPSEESSVRPSSPPFNKTGRSYSIPAILVEGTASDFALQKTESAPANVKRKPVPPRPNVTDTYKETVTPERPFDSLKEVATQSPSARPLVDSTKGLRIDAGLEQLARPGRKQPDTPTDTSKVFVPDSPVEPEIQRSTPLQPTSQLDLIRKRNLERKQAKRGGRRLRIVNM